MKSLKFIPALLLCAVAVAFTGPSTKDHWKQLFNGKDLSGWKVKNEKKNNWEAFSNSSPILDEKNPGQFDAGKRTGGSKAGGDDSPSSLVNVKGGGSDISTEQKFGSGVYEVEFMVPKGSNSGIYLMGEYEVQVLDSFGKPDDKHISTSFVERQNLTMRMHMRRFTRLTNAFSKKAANHCHAVALHFMFYNYAKIHKSLRITPAMAAGVTDHVWTFEEIAALAPEVLARKRGPYKKRETLSTTFKNSN